MTSTKKMRPDLLSWLAAACIYMTMPEAGSGHLQMAASMAATAPREEGDGGSSSSLVSLGRRRGVRPSPP
jgi:hypothetical protein